MIESAVHDLNQGISTFWADKSLARFRGQLFETLTISKITDSFNATDNVQKYSASSIAKMTWLAAVFCATAPSSKSSLAREPAADE